MWSMNKDSSFKSGKDRIMKTKSSNNTLYVITAIASVVVILLAAVGFTNVEAQKVERVSADSNFISRAESAAELAASMGVENDVYQARVQNVAGDNDDDLGRMADALKPIAEYNTDSAALDREVKYLLGGTDTYATTYGGICAAAGEAYRMDLDAANHDAAVWTAVCAVLALAGVARTCRLGHKDRVRQTLISIQFSFFILPIKKGEAALASSFYYVCLTAII